jgi:hypothetical protein
MGGTVAALMANMRVELHPFLVVPSLFMWEPSGRPDLGISCSSVPNCTHGLLFHRTYPVGGYSYKTNGIHQNLDVDDLFFYYL